MQIPRMDEDVDVPDEADVTIEGDLVAVRGPEGELSRSFSHPKLAIRREGDRIVVEAEEPRRRDAALVKTWASHIHNMVQGVTEGFEAELKIVYSHFPIKVKVEDDAFLVENFLGERHPRSARILGDTQVEVQGDTVEVSGPDKEAVGQTAANIESSTRIQGYDPRVFQDGIYITRKP